MHVHVSHATGMLIGPSSSSLGQTMCCLLCSEATSICLNTVGDMGESPLQDA